MTKAVGGVAVKDSGPIGLYIHVPFCLAKCPYCDFYSLTRWDDSVLDAYTARVLRTMEERAETVGPADTLYFGGGTPSLLGGRRLAALITRARTLFGLAGAEITLEANPADGLSETLRAFAAAGGNRLSLGMQSADAELLRFLGRRQQAGDLEKSVAAARAAGITNLSLDMMLALAGQTEAAVRRSVAAAADLEATHVSAYLLKLEADTPFGRHPPALPEDDEAAALYEYACEALEAQGYRQYEISNFARPGWESRHNLKYWDMAPYEGIGPAAHSFLNGERRCYPRSLSAFLQGEPDRPEPSGAIQSGSPEEYLMLRLRLREGLTEIGYQARFGTAIPALWRQRAAALPLDLITADARGIRLSRSGFLLSNALLSRLL